LNDRAAWDQFVDQYAPRIFHWCRRHQLQEQDAADVTQDVLYKLVRAMESFQYDANRGTFRAWLSTVTTNAIRDLVKSRQRPGRGSGDTIMVQVMASIEDEKAVDALTDAIEAGYRQELLHEAEQKIRQRVQERTWRAYQMAAVEQRPPLEVAEELEMRVAEVYVAKSRVLKMLREEVQSLEETSWSG
jgi:RNA polymerase sigma-70 factor (ECF subfamily)